MIILTVMTGSIMSALDTSIVNVALPHMQGTFGASVEEIAWVSTGYILSCVIVMQQASMLSFNHVFFILAVLFMLSMPLVILIKDPRMMAMKNSGTAGSG